MPAQAAIFDLDGTLIDSHRDIARALNLTLDALGFPQCTEAQVRAAIGGGVHALLQKATGSNDPHVLRRGRALFGPAYESTLLATTRLYPGIEDMLQTLRGAGVGIVLATNKPRAFTERIVQGLGLTQLGITAWASADEVPERKPDPAVVRLALARAGLSDLAPEAQAYVGDMAVDVETARAHGVRGIGVAWGFDPEGCRRAGPDIWVDSPEQLGQHWA